ncbi:hypothetical protein SNEBB_011230 [Seison nebaliae]|nr:hypothetical protein SNEBB_011230 [Seison nebaliae]
MSTEGKNSNISNEAEEDEMKKKTVLPTKNFQARNSVLTELFLVDHIQTIYHIFVAILILFVCNTFAFDLIEEGRLNLDFDLLRWAFGDIVRVLKIWCGMKISTLILVYSSYVVWVHCRHVKMIDRIFLGIYIFYQISFFLVPIVLTYDQQRLPVASASIIVLEQLRLMMKSHSFIRENIGKVLRRKVWEKKKNKIPYFNNYIYFLFAPTLIYRDEYPRTKQIRWNFVMANFTQVVACVFFLYYLFSQFCLPVFKNFNENHLTLHKFIRSIFLSTLPGSLSLFISFYCFLHAWLNAWAEMLRFADRLFYKDWWNSTSFSQYYRKWNIVVHDWLFTYIYKDVFLIFRKRTFSLFVVFAISALLHEYVLVFAFGFFYPVLFVLFFGPGVLFVFLSRRKPRSYWNVIMWVALFSGQGLLMCLYSVEWYSRRNCMISDIWLIDFIKPRSWFCQSPRTLHNITTNTTSIV